MVDCGGDGEEEDENVDAAACARDDGVGDDVYEVVAVTMPISGRRCGTPKCCK